MDPLFITAAQFGAAGALIRAVLGLLKMLLSRKKPNWTVFCMLLIFNTIAGIFLAILFNQQPVLSLLIGYASFELLDALNKIIKFKSVSITPGMGIKSVPKRTLFDEMMEFR
ncbi:hypothetical protein HY492_01515 [Candidatus Woesearchaeota archaeon]|nr:hypothetical protein [Candidatus Woesearchaeota archaeon]